MDEAVSLSDFLGQLSQGLDAVEGGLLGAEPYHGKRVAVLCIEMGRRLLACLDIYQAVREARPYHPARSHGDTMDILYGMERRGLVDRDICVDLDVSLKRLEDGMASPPPETEAWQEVLFQREKAGEAAAVNQ